jgi:hypothetical protein
VSRPPQSSFDRVRPRSANTDSGHIDTEGRRALFSVADPAPPAFGSVSVECSRCHQLSVLGLRQVLRLALPSVYLPVVRGRYPLWLRCPACRERAWTRVRLRV